MTAGSVVCAASEATRGAGYPPSAARRRPAWGTLAAPLALGLVAAVFRFYRLDELPGALAVDQAQNGADALRILAGERPIFLPASGGREPLFIYLQTIAVGLLGPTPLSLYVASAVVGCATVVALYVAGRELHGARVGFLAALWLAISYWHVSLSRLGLAAVSLPLLELASLFCAARAMRTGRLQWAAAAGLCLGLTQYTYSAARLFPAAFALIVVALWLAHPPAWGATRSRALRLLATTAIVAVIVALPLGIYLIRHPEFTLGLQPTAAVGGPGDPRGWRDGLRPRTPIENAVTTAAMFGFGGDEDRRHNLPGRPVWDLPTFALFLGGVGLAGWQRRRLGLLYLPWLLLMLYPGAVAFEAPHFLRTAGALPPAFLLLGIGADRLLRRGSRRGQRLATGLVVLLLGFGAADTANGYFRVFAAQAGRADRFDAHVAAAVERVRHVRAAGNAVWTVSATEHPAFHYLLPSASRPTGHFPSVAQAIAAARSAGQTIGLECFGCEMAAGQTDVGPVILVEVGPGRPTDSFRPLDHVIADRTLLLRGYELRLVAASPGGGEPDAIRARLYWQSLAPTGQRYDAALFLRDGDEPVVAVASDRWAGRLWPTTLWRRGDQFSTVLGAPLPRGNLDAGSEFRATLEIFAVPADQPAAVERLDLGRVRLGPP